VRRIIRADTLGHYWPVAALDVVQLISGHERAADDIDRDDRFLNVQQHLDATQHNACSRPKEEIWEFGDGVALPNP
jgi:hypothetical protein